MTRKGLDSTFVHYGIRKDDMEMIKSLSVKHDLDFDWIKDEILKEFHEKKINSIEMDDKVIVKIIEKALSKIKQRS